MCVCVCVCVCVLFNVLQRCRVSYCIVTTLFRSEASLEDYPKERLLCFSVFKVLSAIMKSMRQDDFDVFCNPRGQRHVNDR